jgi:hypothetical protein
VLTLFSIPKAFRGHIGVIQRNAIRSWKLLHPDCEVILFGDDPGTDEAARELGVRHVPELPRDESGTPIVTEAFLRAQRMARNELLAFVNTDILLFPDFADAVQRIARVKPRFLMAGYRWNLDVTTPLAFEPGWERALRDDVSRRGQRQAHNCIDYFAFRRGLWGEMPPLAVGRMYWDNWLLYGARARGAALVDASEVVLIVHQNHDYAHFPGGEAAMWKGPALRNLELAGGPDHLFTLRDATHLLTRSGLRVPLDPWHLWRRIETLPTLHPWTEPPVRALRYLNGRLRPLRKRLGMTVSPRGPNDA